MGGFEDPWEQRRLLSDAGRNAALALLLQRRAPGARVLEVGCGTGVWSVLAARLGARRVVAVEPTVLHELAARLVAENGLGDIVQVRQGFVEDLPAEPVDLAFSELLNADPFFEGVVPAMGAAARWLAPGGLLAPRRMRVHAALCRANDPAREARAAVREVRALGVRFGLRLGAVEEWLGARAPARAFTLSPEAVSTAALAWDVAFGEQEPPEVVEVEVEVTQAGPVAGVVVWFEADLDDGLTLSNPPGTENHWGTLVFGFPDERGLRAGQKVALTLRRVEGRLQVAW